MTFLTITHPKTGAVEAINISLIARAEWIPTADGCDGNLQLRLMNNELRNVPFQHPDLPAAAEAVGLKEVYGAWPKRKAEAEGRRAKARQEREAQKARQQQRRGIMA